jgi:hypothetical protein
MVRILALRTDGSIGRSTVAMTCLPCAVQYGRIAGCRFNPNRPNETSTPPPLFHKHTAHPIDIYSPDIHDVIDVTDERLRNLYDAFDRDFDGRLSKPELLQGLAQQGFHNLEGTRAFELLWETCEKITTIGGEEEGGGASPSSSAVKGEVRARDWGVCMRGLFGLGRLHRCEDEMAGD